MGEPFKKSIQFKNAEETSAIFGPVDEYLRMLEERFPVSIVGRGTAMTVSGPRRDVESVTAVIDELRDLWRRGGTMDRATVSTAILEARRNGQDGQGKGEEAVARGSVPGAGARSEGADAIPVPSKRRIIRPRTEGQRRYVQAMQTHDVVFSIGPAGTGKTYLAVAMAVRVLWAGEVSRIILVRPAVEAGERLGFLPGTFQEKIDPYLRPLYDALYEMLEIEKFRELLDRGVIELAPLAYMRGRTLNNAFIILDEAQNVTIEQMKMFLTRLGFDSRAVITGDITQVDLPPEKPSGLIHAQTTLKGIQGIGFVAFDERDVVRHELVQKIVHAYAIVEGKEARRSREGPSPELARGARGRSRKS